MSLVRCLPRSPFMNGDDGDSEPNSEPSEDRDEDEDVAYSTVGYDAEEVGPEWGKYAEGGTWEKGLAII